MSHLSINTRQITVDFKEDILDEKMDRLENMIENGSFSCKPENPNDRIIVICSTDKLAGTVSQFLNTGRTHHHLFQENKKGFWTKNMEEFENGKKLVALTSFSAMEKEDFPVARQYIVFDFPSKPIKIGKLLTALDSNVAKEQIEIKVTFMLTEHDEQHFKDALIMEMENRGSEVRGFLRNGISTPEESRSSPTPSTSAGTLNSWNSKLQNLATSSSEVSTSSEKEKKAPKRKADTPVFDIWSVKQSPDGFWRFPAPKYEEFDSEEEEYIGEDYEMTVPRWMFESDPSF